eukprot:5632286-Pyramimonas_sp.AAC.1
MEMMFLFSRCRRLRCVEQVAVLASKSGPPSQLHHAFLELIATGFNLGRAAVDGRRGRPANIHGARGPV